MSATPHVPFAAGRVTPDGQRLVVVSPSAPCPIPGPWELRAVTASQRATLPGGTQPAGTPPPAGPPDAAAANPPSHSGVPPTPDP